MSLLFGLQRLLRPLTAWAFRSRVRHEIVFEKREPYPPERPLIFAVNHSCMHDVPIANVVIGEHTCLLSSNELEHDIEGMFLRLTGAVFVDRASGQSGRRASDSLQRRLADGMNVLIFPEGTWNLWPSTPMLPMRWGVTELAKRTGAPVVPICLEYRGGLCYVRVGAALSFAPDADGRAAVAALRDAMATLRWKTWETFPTEKRADIAPDEFDRLAARIRAEYEYYDAEREKTLLFREYDSAEEVFAFKERLNVTQDNAFCCAVGNEKREGDHMTEYEKMVAGEAIRTVKWSRPDEIYE